MKPLDHDALRTARGGVHSRRPIVAPRVMAGLSALAVHLVALTLVLAPLPSERHRSESPDALKLFAPTPLAVPEQVTVTQPARPAMDSAPRREEGSNIAKKTEPTDISIAASASAPPAAPAPPPSVAAALVDIPKATPPRPLERTEAASQTYARLLWSHIAQRRPVGISLAGTTIISFRLDTQGRLLAAELSRSSGNMMLDRLALRTVRMASPYPPPPAELTQEALTFSIPFSFR